MMTPVKSVDEYIAKARQWKEELIKLRAILLTVGLTEEVKWNSPIYTLSGKNIAGIAAFKSYVGLWFHQGALLKDEKGKLINAQEGKTKALRQWRFTSLKEVDPKLIKAYLKEAIANSSKGLEIKPAKKTPIKMPAELAQALKANGTALKKFKSLTPGRQREYVEFIAEASKAETRAKRVAKIVPMISKGLGLNDKYR